MTTKKDKALQDFESQYRDVHKQLGEQLKTYDARTECKLSVLTDYQEFYKRLGEVELEYARNLDKVAERFQDKLRQKSPKKDKMNTVDIFSRILQDLKSRAKIRSFIATRVSENMANRFAMIIEDVQRVNKKCRETSVTLQEELMKQLNELNEKLRRYHTMQTESKLAESKLKTAESALQKLQAPRKRASVKRAKNADKQKDKCHKRYIETKLKAMRARNEYILSLEATNAFVKKYFDQDVYDILEWYDHNYQQAFQRAMDYYAGMEIQASKMLQKDLTSLKDHVKGMNAEKERLQIASDSPHTFQFTGNFVFINHSDDEVCQITAQEHDTLDKTHSDVEKGLKTAKSETEEINKSLEAAKDTLRNTYNKLDQELSAGFSNEKGGSAGGFESSANKSNREELENYYLAKFKELIMTSSVRTRLQAKYNALMKALGGEPGKRPPQLPMKPTAKTQALIANAHKKYQLFGSKLEDYVKVTGRQVPEIVESCIRFITKFGMEHQGIFRVPGSSTEINDLKEAFENGRDPLAGLNHWKDINAVAGVLRCYFRELEDPLFPRAYYQEFIEASRIYDSDEQARALNHVIKKLPDAVVTVMKYLFKFLFAVTKYREQNKMDAHNLSVVFGPTLIRVSEEDDMISSQGHFNKVVETIIKSYEMVFDGEGLDTVDNDLEEEEQERQTEDELSKDDSDSEEEVEPKEAKALYNYTARSDKELSFKKGNIILVFKRSNDDWWDGSLDGVDGFVPCAYVQVTEDDAVDGHSPESRTAPQSLSLDSSAPPGCDNLPSPSSTRSTPTHPPNSTFGQRPTFTSDDGVQSQILLRHHSHKASTPEVIPEETHLSSFKRSSFKRPTSPTKSPSGSLERSRSLNDQRTSPKTVTPGDVSRTASLPRSSANVASWDRKSQNIEPLSPVEARGTAEGSFSPALETGQSRGPAQFTRAPPPAPKPKPKPKVPKRNSNPSTELIASLNAGSVARTARHESHGDASDHDDLPPPPPPCEEREVVGGETPSPPHSPVGKQDTFL